MKTLKDEHLDKHRPRCGEPESCGATDDGVSLGGRNVSGAAQVFILRNKRVHNVISTPAGYIAQFFSNSWASRSYLATIPSEP
jgi:hypothetical protein